MLFLSSRTNTKYTKYSNYNNLLSFDNKKLTVLSPELSLTYKCLLNHIKYNKLELSYDTFQQELKTFIKYYQSSKLFYMRDTFKQEIKAVNNSKYWNILTDPHLLSISIILISMFRTKEPIPSTVKLFFVGFIIGLVVFKIFQIETQDPLKEEVQYMLNLQNKLNNIKNITGCSAGSVFGLLIALKYTSIELKEILTNLHIPDYIDITADRILNFTNLKGLDSGNKLLQLLKTLISNKNSNNPDLTFKQLYERFDIKLQI